MQRRQQGPVAAQRRHPEPAAAPMGPRVAVPLAGPAELVAAKRQVARAAERQAARAHPPVRRPLPDHPGALGRLDRPALDQSPAPALRPAQSYSEHRAAYAWSIATYAYLQSKSPPSVA